MDITFNNCSLNVQTIASSEQSRADIVISEASDYISAKSTIKITGQYSLTICIFWQRFTAANDISIYFAEKENVLFVGVGCVSAVINIATKQILDINYPDLFWSWECVGEHILELGELECRLLSKEGKLIGSAPVDPPYEYQVLESSVEFSSIVMGKTRIALSES